MPTSTYDQPAHQMHAGTDAAQVSGHRGGRPERTTLTDQPQQAGAQPCGGPGQPPCRESLRHGDEGPVVNEAH